MAITFQKETFAACLDEFPPLWYPHWREVALNQKEIPLNPDWLAYADLERTGALHIMTARDNGKLIGYYFAFVRTHLHYRQSLTGWSDVFYIAPEYRRGLIGYKLFAETDAMLKALGVQKSYVVTKAQIPINIIMERRGYRLIENVYAKLL